MDFKMNIFVILACLLPLITSETYPKNTCLEHSDFKSFSHCITKRETSRCYEDGCISCNKGRCKQSCSGSECRNCPTGSCCDGINCNVCIDGTCCHSTDCNICVHECKESCLTSSCRETCVGSCIAENNKGLEHMNVEGNDNGGEINNGNGKRLWNFLNVRQGTSNNNNGCSGSTSCSGSNGCGNKSTGTICPNAKITDCTNDCKTGCNTPEKTKCDYECSESTSCRNNCNSECKNNGCSSNTGCNSNNCGKSGCQIIRNGRCMDSSNGCSQNVEIIGTDRCMNGGCRSPCAAGICN